MLVVFLILFFYLVVVDDSCLQADPQPKSGDLV